MCTHYSYGPKGYTRLSLHLKALGKFYSQCTSHRRATKLPIVNYRALKVQLPTSLINYMKYFQQVYELSVWTKRLHKTFSTSHSSGKFLQLVYKLQENYKVTYNQIQRFKHIATHPSLINYMKYFQQVYELSV